jgi:hypothetical protein
MSNSLPTSGEPLIVIKDLKYITAYLVLYRGWQPYTWAVGGPFLVLEPLPVRGC